MMILRATSILGGQNEDKGMMCNITGKQIMQARVTKCHIYIYMLIET
jgi:hypothetical protein